MGTSLVLSVEGQQAVLPVWYTSYSQDKPYVTWVLNKNAAPSQVRRGQGLQDGGLEGRIMEGCWWRPRWGEDYGANHRVVAAVPMVEGCP